MSDKTPKKQTQEKKDNSEEVATSVPATTEQTKKVEAGKDVGAGAANIDNFLIPDGLNPRTKNDRIFNGVSVSTIPGTALKGNIVTEAANLAKLANTRQFFNKTDFATAVVLKVFEITDEAVALMKLRGHSRRLQLTTSRTAPQDTSVIGMQNTDLYEGLESNPQGGTFSVPGGTDSSPAAAGGDSDGQPQMPLVMVYAACDRYHTSGPNLNGDNMDAVYEFYGPPFFALSNRKLKQGDLIEVKYLSEEPYGSGIWKDDYIAQQQRFLGGSGMNMLGIEVEGGVKLGNGKKAHERISFPNLGPWPGAAIAQREFNNWGHFVKSGPDDKRMAYPYMFTEADKEAVSTIAKYWRVGANANHSAILVEDPTNIYIKYVPHFRKKGSETETKSYRGKKYPLIWTGSQVQKKDFTWQVNDKSAEGKGHIPGASNAAAMAWSAAFISYCMRHDPSWENFNIYIKSTSTGSRKVKGLKGTWASPTYSAHNYYLYAAMIHTMEILSGKPHRGAIFPWVHIPRPQNEKTGPWEKNYGSTIFKRISKYITVQKSGVGVETGDIAMMLAVIHDKPGSYHGDIVVLGDKGMADKSIPIPERWLNCIVNKNSAKYPPKRGDTKKKGKKTKKDAKKKTKTEAKTTPPAAPAPSAVVGPLLTPAVPNAFTSVVDDTLKRADAASKGKFSKEEYDAMRQKAIDNKLVFKIGGNVSQGPGHSGGSPGLVGFTFSRTDSIFTRRPECIKAVRDAAANVSDEDKAWFAEQLKRFVLRTAPGGVIKRVYDINGNRIAKVKEPDNAKESAKETKKKPQRKAKKKEESKTPPAKK